MRATKRRIVSRSTEQTQEIGIQIANELKVPCVLLLRGALGTGKTTLARGIALGLGIEDGSLVSSPSFTLVNIYRGRCPIYHVDLYRLENERDIRSTGLDEFLDVDGVTIVEWGERLPVLPDDAVIVDLKDAGGDTRILDIWKTGPGTRRRRSPRRSSTGRRLILCVFVSLCLCGEFCFTLFTTKFPLRMKIHIRAGMRNFHRRHEDTK